MGKATVAGFGLYYTVLVAPMLAWPRRAGPRYKTAKGPVMKTIARFLVACLFIAPGVYAADPAASKAPADQPQFMFVQSAKAVSYQDGKLTLKDVAAATVFFSDRPERIVGHMPTSQFIPFWSQGQDSFLKDNPNASLSVFQADAEPAVVEVTLKNPVLTGTDLTYEVVLLNGKVPANGAEASLFIDIIGMPRTAYSYAGAARRNAYYRRY